MATRLRVLAAFVADVYREIVRDRALLSAAAMSFYGIVSLFPLILFAVGVLGYVVGSYDAALEQILLLASEYLPSGTSAIESDLHELSRQSGLLSGIGLLGLLWAGLQVFVILQQVMSIALGGRHPIGYLRARATALAMVLASGALLILSVGATSLVTALRAYRFLGFDPNSVGALWSTLAILGPLMVSGLAFALIYRFLSYADTGGVGSIIGGLTAGLLFEAGKYAFRWYLTEFTGISRIYGSLGGLAVLVFWIHYIAVVTVVGAEVTSVYARWKGRAYDSGSD